MNAAQTTALTTALREIMAEVDAAMMASGQGACYATRKRLVHEAQQRRAAATKPAELWVRAEVAA